MEKCKFCLYRDGCIGELPGDDGKCMAFVVSKEDAPAYENFLAEEARKKERERELLRSLLEDLIDPSTETELTPSFHGKDCLGNGEHPGIECCCDECDHYLTCFPEQAMS